MKKERTLLIGIILLVFIMIGFLIGRKSYIENKPNDEMANLESIYGVSSDGDVSIIFNYGVQKATAIYRDDVVYVPLNWVQAIVNDRFYWDEEERLLVYAFPESITYSNESTTGNAGKKLIYIEGDKVYILASLIKSYSDVQIDEYTSDEIKRIYITNSWGEDSTSLAGKKTALRTGPSIKDTITVHVPEGAVLESIDHNNPEADGWRKVITSDGYMGYIQDKHLKNTNTINRNSSYIEPVYSNISVEGPIVLAWHQLTVADANSTLSSLLDASSGITIISPTWYTLSDDNGNISSLASREYVETAHARGIQVWALVDNFTGEGDTYKVLSHTSSRETLINNLIEQAETIGFDGINLDFETIMTKTAPHYIEFIRELSVACRRKGLVFSIDNPSPASFNTHYNRKEQGIVADYVINMGYDEHYSGSEPGSVASYGFVKEGIEDCLNEVPNEKLINAIPFYTRLWTEDGDKISSTAMGIAKAKQWIADNSVNLIWDENVGQYYGEQFTDSGKNYLWMEEEESLELKMELIKSADLAGVACWKIGLESPNIWSIVNAIKQ